MKKEIPILFSMPMVEAILDGRKTKTRRIVTGKHLKMLNHIGFDDFNPLTCPKGVPGDLLWVRETFYAYGHWTKLTDTGTGKIEWRFNDLTLSENKSYMYLDAPPTEICKKRFGLGYYKRPSIHMPKVACRIYLEVISVRVEILKNISPGDASDEGVNYWNVDKDAFEGGELIADYENYMWRDDPEYEDYFFPSYGNPVDSFFSLWEKINGRESLDLNPWVWVIEFKKTVKPNA